jgi:hypothetical protein
VPPERYTSNATGPRRSYPEPSYLFWKRLNAPAKRSGIRADRQRYHDAINDLEYEGAIEWDESARYARGDKHYLITRRGLDDLASAETVAIQEGQRKLFED